MTALQRFLEPIGSIRDLVTALSGTPPETEDLPTGVDDAVLVHALASIPATIPKDQLDAALVEPVHAALASLSRREALDARLWHSLSVAHADIVWRRWSSGTPTTTEEIDRVLRATREMPKHFLGTATLNGVSRNTFARLWWVAEILRDGDDYTLARHAFSSQQLIQSLFERRLGLRPALARAFTYELHDKGDAAILDRSLGLAQMAPSLSFESLNETELRVLIREL
ncbi:MAG: hypothetical protein JWN72_2543 [Thermoleophilia bacterium]|nr:hypothetical protein [Thermoleophilia bacterium]